MTDRYMTLNFHGRAIPAAIWAGIPWFGAAELGALLGYTDPDQAVFELVCPEDSAQITIDRPGLGVPPIRQWVVSDSGLADLIAHSQHPNAERMRLWLGTEVLPLMDIPRDDVPAHDEQLVRDLANGPSAVLDLLATVVDHARRLLMRNRALEMQIQHLTDVAACCADHARTTAGWPQAPQSHAARHGFEG